MVEGVQAYDEDLWKRVEVGGHALTTARLCNRCSVTQVDPDAGTAKLGDPLKTLRAYRLYKHLWCSDSRHKNNPLFGIKLSFDIPDGGTKQGSIRLGQLLEVLEYRSARDRAY